MPMKLIVAETVNVIGSLLRSARESRGLSKAGAARLAGVDWRRWHLWETGQEQPRDVDAVLDRIIAGAPAVRRRKRKQ